MFVALEQASVLLASKESYKRALVIGSDHLTMLGDEKQPIPSTIVGDAAAAIILEKILVIQALLTGCIRQIVVL